MPDPLLPLALLLVNDLAAREKLKSPLARRGYHPVRIRTLEALQATLEQLSDSEGCQQKKEVLAVVDLEGSIEKPLDAAQLLATHTVAPIVGFYSHVHEQVGRTALESGFFTDVLPRSKVLAQPEKLFSRLLGDRGSPTALDESLQSPETIITTPQ